MFESRPPVTKECGARLLVSEHLSLKLQYLHLKQGNEKQGNLTCTHVLEKGFVEPTDDASDLAETVPVSMVRDEIMAVWKEWFGNYVPLNEKSKIDAEAFKKKLAESVEEGKKRVR